MNCYTLILNSKVGEKNIHSLGIVDSACHVHLYYMVHMDIQP